MWRGIRPADVGVTSVLAGLGVVLMVEDIFAHDPTTRIDSRSWWLVPAFLAAVVPVLWWRRNLLAVLTVSVAAMTLHDVVFGHLVRCGAGLPVAFVLAFPRRAAVCTASFADRLRVGRRVHGRGARRGHGGGARAHSTRPARCRRGVGHRPAGP